MIFRSPRRPARRVGGAALIASGLLAVLPAVAEADYRYVRQWAVPTEARSIDVGAAGIYVSNGVSASTPSKVTRYTPEGKLTATFGSFDRPGADGLSVGPDGRVWVVDRLGTIKVFDAGGNQLEQQPFLDSCGGGAEVGLNDVEVDAAGDLYAGIYDNCALGTTGALRVVSRVSPGWKPAGFWGGPDGSGADGQFGRSALSIASDGRGSVYVSDSGNHRIQQFSSTGAFVRKWGQLGSGRGQFNGPQGIAIGPSGDVFVADHNNGRIQRFGPDGRFREEIRVPADVKYIGAPHDVAVDRSGRLYVLSTERHTEDEVSVFEPGGVAVRSSALRYAKRTIKVKLRCTAAATCRGSVRLRKGETTLASRSYRVKAATTATVSLKPTARGHRTITSARKHGVTLSVKPKGAEATTKKLTLRR